jgi:hypothetical protein
MTCTQTTEVSICKNTDPPVLATQVLAKNINNSNMFFFYETDWIITLLNLH